MLFVVGLDGATFDLLDPWLETGYLPTLARLRQAGVAGELASTMPPVTSPAWPSFMTGKNPGNYGVFDFFRRNTADLDDVELINSNHINGRFLWEYLSDAGWQVGVLNVPATYPPRPVNGFIVPGLLSPDQGQTTYPPNLLKSYTAELGRYRLTPDLLYQPGNEAAFIAELTAVTETQIQYAQRLLADHPVDFLMLHFLATDIAQHKLWRYLDDSHPWFRPSLGAKFGSAVRDLYRQIDTALGQMLDQLPPDSTVVVMSDHGFGPQHQTVNLNNFFIQTGLMALKPEASVRWRTWAVRQSWATRLWRRLGRNWQLSFADVDWSRTVAYSLGHMGQVYLNRQGREAQGIVTSAEYPAVLQRVTAVLQTLRHPTTNKPMVDAIIPGDEVATGPYAGDGPDLHVILDGYRALAYPMFAADGRLVTEQIYGDSGHHRRQGILMACGPAIPSRETIADARIIDLAPTILHLMSVPVPDDMDGRVLTQALTADFLAQNPITYQPARPVDLVSTGLSAAETAEVESRLRSLGYLEPGK